MFSVVAYILLPFIAALVAAVWVFPKVLHIALNKNIVDNPDARKLQRIPVPVLGGMVVQAGILVALCVADLLVDCNNLYTIVLAMSIMLFIGTLDDILDIPSTTRFILEILVALMIIYTCGYSLDNLHGLWDIWALSPWVSVPLTIVTVVGVINSINLIDGVDGYSSGYCIMACVMFGVFFYLVGDMPMTMLAIVCAASLIPFFMHNVFGRTSKMFIGDGGTLLMGCVMSVFVLNILKTSTHCEQYCAAGLGLVPFTLAVLSVPVFDTVRVMTMRMIRKTSPFTADKTHLHHMFIELGFSHIGTTVSILTLNCLVVLGWSISYHLGANVDVQLYVVIALSLLVTVGFYYGMRLCIKKDWALYRFMQRVGRLTHVERKGFFLWIQEFVDRDAITKSQEKAR
ncbi:MAG: undecaprenyl/decaprenyl-phosphate alpha-N-acetylglucosaminyl 1-phosphate transferase [Bacteroidaceae bacterium]|nr:undecaprenyl/decaprenyl-phosphate alpha-N-acetylglucosaminyl 1-phosphate transferase [Bacteroidaceae bacterium]